MARDGHDSALRRNLVSLGLATCGASVAVAAGFVDAVFFSPYVGGVVIALGIAALAAVGFAFRYPESLVVARSVVAAGFLVPAVLLAPILGLLALIPGVPLVVAGFLVALGVPRAAKTLRHSTLTT